MKRFITLLVAVSLSLSFVACSNTKDSSKESNKSNENKDVDITIDDTDDIDNTSTNSYCGTWNYFGYDYDYFTLNITANNLSLRMSDSGDTDELGPFTYKASTDSNYTYLEFEVEGTVCVLVVLNEDMIVVCYGDEDNSAHYVGTTPLGTKFDAEISGSWFFRDGAESLNIPSQWQDEFYELTDIDGYCFYYENAQVFSIPGYWAWPAVAVTENNELSGMEGITLIGLEKTGELAIKAKGNFIIIDNT